MADDHYVAQTYLKGFTDPAGLLVPYFKNGRIIVGKPKPPKSVCYKPDGNTNPFFQDEKTLEKYVGPLENNWIQHLDLLRQGNTTEQSRFQIAAYLAFLRTCTPTAVRKGVKNMQGILRAELKMLAAQGGLNHPDHSPELNARMVDMVMDDKITHEVDPAYIQARNALTLNNLTMTLVNADWKVLLDRDEAFLTSDNPLCMYFPHDKAQMCWFYAPLQRDMAMLIRPKPEYNDAIKSGGPIPYGEIQYGKPKAKLVFKFNQNLIRQAEEKVFFREKAAWVERLVAANKGWKAEALVDTIPHPTGYYHIVRDRVVKSA